MKKFYKSLALILAFVFTFTTGAFAASNSEKISALLNKAMKIKVNGKLFTAKDSKGKVLYPISYNGATYLPVTSLAEALKIPASYDPKTSTYTIGSTDMKVNLLDLISSTSHGSNTGKYLYVAKDKQSLTLYGETYKSGLASKRAYYGVDYYFKLDGKYSKLSFKVGLEGETGILLSVNDAGKKASIYSDKIYQKEAMEEIELDVTGIKNLSISFENVGSKETEQKFLLAEPILQ